MGSTYEIPLCQNDEDRLGSMDVLMCHKVTLLWFPRALGKFGLQQAAA